MASPKTADERRAEYESLKAYRRAFLDRLETVTSKTEARNLAVMQLPNEGPARELHLNLSSFLDEFSAPRDATVPELMAYSGLFERISADMPADARANVLRQLAAAIDSRKSFE